MPHQCTQCGHTFPDGSKEMLSGCPDCGGNKFRFQPAADAREASAANSSTTPTAAGSGSRTEPTPNDEATTEDHARADAQHDARADRAAGPADADSGAGSDTQSVDESGPPEADPQTESAEDSDMEALRRQLNDQFESIKIVEPGQYELNLMELYNREEYIIALQEDGQYVIEVPETWLGDE